jgi:hypothetical protein
VVLVRLELMVEGWVGWKVVAWGLREYPIVDRYVVVAVAEGEPKARRSESKTIATPSYKKFQL